MYDLIIFYNFQMSILESVCTGLGALFLTALCFIAIDIFISWIWKSILKKTNDRISLKGKHVIVTGGSKGIGKEVAKEFVKRGANVTIMARNPQQLADANLEISKLIKHEPNSCLSSGSPSAKRQKVLDIALDVTSDNDVVAKSIRL